MGKYYGKILVDLVKRYFFAYFLLVYGQPNVMSRNLLKIIAL